jgi:uncharacterized membrane protein
MNKIEFQLALAALVCTGYGVFLGVVYGDWTLFGVFSVFYVTMFFMLGHLRKHRGKNDDEK